MVTCFLVFQLSGLGMGFVTLATLVVVQNSVDIGDMGVATASNQFARTLGGTVGVGICGGVMTSKLWQTVDTLVAKGQIPNALDLGLAGSDKSIEVLLQPEFQNRLAESLRTVLQEAIAGSVSIVFWIALLSSILCLMFCVLLPGTQEADQ